MKEKNQNNYIKSWVKWSVDTAWKYKKTKITDFINKTEYILILRLDIN